LAEAKSFEAMSSEEMRKLESVPLVAPHPTAQFLKPKKNRKKQE
jgi:hypothetical protein